MSKLDSNSTFINVGDIAGRFTVIEIWVGTTGRAYFSCIRFPDGDRYHMNLAELQAAASTDYEISEISTETPIDPYDNPLTYAEVTSGY